MSKEEMYRNITPKALNELSAGKAGYAEYMQGLKNDKGLAERWYEPSCSVASWNAISLPGRWEESAIGDTDGIIWFRREFQVDKAALSKKATLRLGMIDDEDLTYVNGRFIGEEDEWNKERHYEIPDGLLVEGTNTVTVRIRDNQGPGGMFSDAGQIVLDFGDSKIPLTGQWKYKASVTTKGFGMQHSGPNEFPSQLFNAMVAPLTRFAIKGAIWYQGEANASEAKRYRSLFPEMISDWRKHWKDVFPFYWVQLANFMAPSEQPSESQWAELREAQSSALAAPHTGQAVIIDLGDAGDIHPRNKRDVGYRLALLALKNTYGRDIVGSGPRYQSSKIEQDKIILTFTEVGSGLKANDKYGYLKGFAIAGNDKKFVWAKAYIDGQRIIVYCDKVKVPIAVRYAWADNPDDANLYNNENLPASPFRTDL
jgi:sialate O-acetylesterase